jgi:hypothetical protein
MGVGLSKFYLNVCLPPTAPEGVRVALEAAMAPFDINLASAVDGNPDGEWDWWHIATGDVRFAVKPSNPATSTRPGHRGGPGRPDRRRAAHPRGQWIEHDRPGPFTDTLPGETPSAATPGKPRLPGAAAH